MENLAHLDWQTGGRVCRALFGETAHADDPLGAHYFQDQPQMRVANSGQGFAFGRTKFVRRQIAARSRQKRQRAVINHEMAREEFFRRPKAPGE